MRTANIVVIGASGALDGGSHNIVGIHNNTQTDQQVVSLLHHCNAHCNGLLRRIAQEAFATKDQQCFLTSGGRGAKQAHVPEVVHIAVDAASGISDVDTHAGSSSPWKYRPRSSSSHATPRFSLG